MSRSTTPSPRAYRFQRRLTDAELATVLAASRQGGVNAGMPALWDVILGEAEGVTWNEAIEQGQQFEPGHYAIPVHQADTVRQALEHSGAGLLKVSDTIALAWLDLGPATYYPAPWLGRSAIQKRPPTSAAQGAKANS